VSSHYQDAIDRQNERTWPPLNDFQRALCDLSNEYGFPALYSSNGYAVYKCEADIKPHTALGISATPTLDNCSLRVPPAVQALDLDPDRTRYRSVKSIDEAGLVFAEWKARIDEWKAEVATIEDKPGKPITTDRLMAAMTSAGYHVKQSDKGIIYWRTSQRPVIEDGFLRMNLGYDIDRVPDTVEEAMKLIEGMVNYHGDLLLDIPKAQHKTDTFPLTDHASGVSVGDIVYLMSGGDPMTVTAVNKGMAGLIWIDVVWMANGVIGRDQFSPEVLTLQKP
jgi:uncharacterized protein YodC (DUF2158 family)